MIDEHALSFGKSRIMGCPFHGLVRANQLTLPNATTITGTWQAAGSRGSYRFAVPGVPAVSRTPEEAAADTAAGFQWRTDAICTMNSSAGRIYLYGKAGIRASALYAVGPGSCWAIRLPNDFSANAEKTELASPGALERYGRMTYAPQDDPVPLTITLSGYDPADFFSYPSEGVIWDSTPTGDKVIIGGASYDSRADFFQPLQGGAYGLITITGTGLPGSPISANLSPLTPVRPGTAAYIDDLETFEGRWMMDFETADEFRSVPGEECQWLFRTIDNPRAVLLPPGPTSSETPGISIVTGTRTASITDYALGFWFDASGSPVPVTMDISYTLTADYNFDISGSGSPPPEYSYPYINQGSGCVPQSGAGGESTPGSFAWSAAVEQTNTELVEIVLRVGGAEIDRYKVRAEFLYTLGFTGTVPAVLLSSTLRPVPPTSGAATVHRRELYVNDALLDSHEETGDSGVGISDVSPIRILDPANQARFTDPHDWLPPLVFNWFNLDINPALAVGADPYWWSNHLVCIRRRQRPHPGSSGISHVYGKTAHPTGVTASEIAVPAPSPVTNAPVRYGARNPFNGTVLLGQTQPVTYI